MVLVGPNLFQVGPPFFFIVACCSLSSPHNFQNSLYSSPRVFHPLSLRRGPVAESSPCGGVKTSRGRVVMAVSKVFVCVLTVLAVVFTVLSPSVQAQSISPAPAPVSDGTSVDQGIAYGLMLAALVLTYLIHPMDASPFGLF